MVRADVPVFEQPFSDRSQVSRDGPTGELTVKNGIAYLFDRRSAAELTSGAPPVWTMRARGEAPAGSYLEVRIKAPPGVLYWVDLVNQSNSSIATVDFQPGTGQWQKHRVRFQGQFGSNGDDLFVRVAQQDPAERDPVMIDYIAVRQGPAAAAPSADRPDRQHNLALSQRECIVFSSSIQNTTDRYTDHLIDGNADTFWRSFPGTRTPTWVMLQWEYPLQIDRLWLVPAAGESPARVTVQVPDGNDWQTVTQVDAPALWPEEGVGISLDSIRTDRIRLLLEADESAAIALAELEAYGPPQPIVAELRPYWSASYIWYPEPDRIIKTGKRYFRTTFEIDDLSRVTTAWLQTRSNDGYVAFINGQEVAAGSITIRPADVKAVLKQGTNCLAFEARSAKDPGWPLMTLLSQLTINAGDASQLVVTDASFRTHTAEDSGWREPGFDDRHWAEAMVCAKPPDQPWGRIPYFDVADYEPIHVMHQAQLSSNPNQSVDVPLELRSAHLPGQDLLLIVSAGEKERNSDRSNYRVASAIRVLRQDEWGADGVARVAVTLNLPSYAPAMTVPVRLEVLGMRERGSIRLTGPDGALPSNEVAQLSIHRPDQSPAQPAASGAQVECANGVGRIRVAGQPLSPLLWALQSPSLDRYEAYSGTGINLYHLQIYPYRIDHNADYAAVHLPFVDQHIRHLLAIDPDARILVEMDLRDSSAWAEANPHERLMTAQGDPKAASMASAVYARDVQNYVRQVVRFMQSQPYRDRVIGYIPEIAEPESAMGGADQNAFEADRLKLNIGDYNPQAIAYFRRFLHEKYDGSVEQLRAAWKDDRVTFETAMPILEELTREGEHGGLFRDPSQGRRPFDYFECLSTMVPNFVLENVGRVIKEETNGQALVGFYYGYTVETLRSVCNPGTLWQGNHFYFDKVIDSPYIDFFMSPLQYEHRMAGDRMFPFQPVDSLKLHGKLYVAEEDIRTYISGLTSYGRHRSDKESVAVMRNHLGAGLIHGTGAWMADWSSGAGLSRTATPFFKTPELLDVISTHKRLYDETAQTERRSAAEIAVFVSSKTIYYHDVAYASVLYNSLICEMLYKQLPKIGAPFDMYSIEDVGQRPVQDDYKLYIFLNAYHMEPETRAAIDRLKRDGKTLLFFYAPDFVSNENGLSIEGVRDMTAMNVQVKNEKRIQSVATLPGRHTLLSGIAPGTTYAAFGFDYSPDVARLHPTAYGPTFYVDDAGTTALAAFDDGAVGLAAKDLGGWKSVYCSVPYLDRQVLKNIAAWAGVHLYTDEAIVVEASNDLVLLHSGHDRDRTLTLSLPGHYEVRDAYTGEVIDRNANAVRVDLPRSSTRLYQLVPAQTKAGGQ